MVWGLREEVSVRGREQENLVCDMDPEGCCWWGSGEKPAGAPDVPPVPLHPIPQGPCQRHAPYQARSQGPKSPNHSLHPS